MIPVHVLACKCGFAEYFVQLHTQASLSHSLNGGRSCEAVIGLLVHSRSAFLNGHAVYKLNQELDLSLFKQKHTRTHIQWQI